MCQSSTEECEGSKCLLQKAKSGLNSLWLLNFGYSDFLKGHFIIIFQIFHLIDDKWSCTSKGRFWVIIRQLFNHLFSTLGKWCRLWKKKHYHESCFALEKPSASWWHFYWALGQNRLWNRRNKRWCIKELFWMNVFNILRGIRC